MIVRGLLAALVAIALFMPGTAFASAPKTGTIQGQIVNGTKGGASVGGLQVALFTIGSDNTTVHSISTADGRGHFVFDGVAIGDSQTYVIAVTFEQVLYLTDVPGFAAGETIKSVKANVFDTTTDDSAINVVNAHTVIMAEPGDLNIQEVYIIANTSDRTYVGTVAPKVGGKNGTLTFPLPAKSTRLELGGDISGDAPELGQGSFSVTTPVFPGETQAFYTYEVKTGSTYTYSEKIYYPTSNYNLLVRGSGVAVESAQLVLGSPMDVGGSHFINYEGDNLTAGSTVMATLSGLPEVSRQSGLVWLGLALAALGGATVLVAVYAGRHRRMATIAADESNDDEENRLFAAIARLDDDHENGKIDEESYRRMRADLKSELAVLIEKANRTKAES